MAVDKEQLENEASVLHFYRVVLSWDYLQILNDSNKKFKGSSRGLRKVKDTFKDVDDYLSTFEPLLFEEVKAQIAQEKTDEHLLFSVTEPQFRIKPAGVSDIMWAEAMGKLEGMESSNRERLWPQLVQGFKDLSQRLKLQDEVIVSDAERLRTTQSNVKLLQRHFQSDTLPRVERLKQKEQGLQRRLLRLRGPGAELSRRVQNLLTVARIQTNAGGNDFIYHPGSTKIDEQSLASMQEVVQQQTEAIARLGSVLK